MAKTKVQKGAEESTKKDSEKPTKKIAKKPRGAKQRPPVPEMVMAAMKKIGEGCTLQLIRNYIAKEFGVKMSKTLQKSIKGYMTEEFQAGRIKMVDNDGDQIKFNQQFQVAQ